MKFSIDPKTLKSTLDRLSSIPGARSVIPVVRVSAGMDGVTFTRITPEATIVAAIGDCEIDDEGEVEVDFSTFSQLSARGRGGVMKIESKPDRIEIKSGAANMRVMRAPDGTMPDGIEPGEESASITMPIEDVLTYLGICAPGASREAAESALNGVCARTMGEGTLHFFGTNRKVVHVAQTPYEADVDTLIPNEVINAIISSFSGMTGSGLVRFYDNCIRVVSENVEITAAISEGKPPNVQKLMEALSTSKKSYSVTADRSELIAALKDASAIAQGDLKAAIINFRPDGVEIRATNGRDAEMDTLVSGSTTGDGCIKVGSMLLAGALSSAYGDEVTLSVVDSPKAIHIEQDDRSFMVALMHHDEE